MTFTLTYYGGNQHMPTGICINPDVYNISISDCIFTNMSHGIYFQNISNLDIRNCTFFNNEDSTVFGVESGNNQYNDNITIIGCIINSNGKELGYGYQTGGISLYFCSDTKISNSTI